VRRKTGARPATIDAFESLIEANRRLINMVSAHGPWNDPGPWILLVPLFWIALIGTVLYLLGRSGAFRRGASAEAVLAERYARGEISDDELRRARSVLRERRR
jgi:putative membrane protein